MQTSPTNIAAYLWSVLAAERLKLIGAEECRAAARDDARHPRANGAASRVLLQRSRPADRRRAQGLPGGLQPSAAACSRRWTTPGWPRRSLMVANCRARHSGSGRGEAPGIDGFPVLLRSLRSRSTRSATPGSSASVTGPTIESFYGHYGMLNSEARIASLSGHQPQATPPRALLSACTARFPSASVRRSKRRTGRSREYLGVKVFEGSYTYRGAATRPELGRQHVRGPHGHPLRPRGRLGPAEAGASIIHSTSRPRSSTGSRRPTTASGGSRRPPVPRGGYEVYGVKASEQSPMGYLSYDIWLPRSQPPLPVHRLAKFNHGVVTPHASFLALRYAPREAIDNLHDTDHAVPDLQPVRLPGLRRRVGRAWSPAACWRWTRA